MEFDPTFTWSNLLTLVTLVVSVATAFYAWFANRRSDVDQRFQAGSKRMADLELRVQATEHHVAAMPGKDDLHAMQLLMSEQNGELKAIRASMRSVAEGTARLERIVSRHEDYLRENT